MTDMPLETAVSMPGGFTFEQVSSLTGPSATALQSAGYAAMLEHVTVLARWRAGELLRERSRDAAGP